MLKKWFHGKLRIDNLKQHFERLRKKGVALYVASFGYAREVENVLKRVGLFRDSSGKPFFTEVIGWTNACLPAKAAKYYYKYKQIMCWRLKPHETLLVDDDMENTGAAETAKASHTLTIPSAQGGLSSKNMRTIEHWSANRKLNPGELFHANGDSVPGSAKPLSIAKSEAQDI
jgi:FMN phosphatase YigB (HAD superfamily)